MDNPPSQSDSILMQHIEDAENLLNEIKSHNNPDSLADDKGHNRERIVNVMAALLPEVECRNGNLSHDKGDKIASLVDQLTGIKRMRNEYVRDYLIRMIIFCYSSREDVFSIIEE